MQTLCPESGLRTAPDCPKIQKMTMTSQFSDMTSSSNFFWRCFVSLVKFSYWSKFHVNIITGSGVMTISFYKGLTRNPEIGNIPVWVFSNICRLGQVMNTKFGTNVSNRMLLNVAKFQGHSFYRFWVIKGKPTGGRDNPPPIPPRLGILSGYGSLLDLRDNLIMLYCSYPSCLWKIYPSWLYNRCFKFPSAIPK